MVCDWDFLEIDQGWTKETKPEHGMIRNVHSAVISRPDPLTHLLCQATGRENNAILQWVIFLKDSHMYLTQRQDHCHGMDNWD